MADGTDSSKAGLPRRTVLQGAALSGVGLALSACGHGQSAATPNGLIVSGPKITPLATPSDAAPTVDALTSTSAVPVGGGVIIANTVVVTQPERGTFKAFSAICTHLGCPVSNVTDGVIFCPCHNSQFSASDGSVIVGPAPSPLPEVPIAVKDGQVVRA